MGELSVLRNDWSKLWQGIVRDRESTPEEIRTALRNLGAECGRQIADAIPLESREVWTPTGDRVDGVPSTIGATAVVTTRADFEVFGTAIAATLNTSTLGYMDFGGVRGRAALSAPVREIELPIPTHKIQRLVIAKSVMATGCTAVSLTQTAIETYHPADVIVASVFYSREGIDEVFDAFPAAHIYVVNSPDQLDDGGMLHPGVGNLDQRI